MKINFFTAHVISTYGMHVSLELLFIINGIKEATCMGIMLPKAYHQIYSQLKVLSQCIPPEQDSNLAS